MLVNVSFHNVDHSDALEHFINQKSQSLSQMLWKGEHLRWVVDKDANELSPHLVVKLKNKHIHVRSRAKNAFMAVNEVFEKARRLVRDNHQRLKGSL